MARFRIDATWFTTEVRVILETVEPRVSILDFDTDVSRLEAGQLHITDPMAMTPKAVRRAALEWFVQYAGMTDRDSYEMQMWNDAGRAALEREFGSDGV